MSDDEKKAAREMQVFEDFIKRSGLPIDRQSIRKCDPPEPDILCKVSGECVHFELAEVCSQEITRATSRAPRTGGVSNFIRSGDPIPEIARKKIEKSKNYRTDSSIELLFYTDGRVVQPPDMSSPSTLTPPQGADPSCLSQPEVGSSHHSPPLPEPMTP